MERTSIPRDYLDSNILQEFSIANFKAFGPEQRVPLKPITLIFGANSSGKSSILQSLILAHEALKGGNLDARRPWIGGESVDLGGFHQYVHRRNLEKEVMLSYEFPKPGSFIFGSELLKESKCFRLTLRIGFHPLKKSPRLAGYTAHVDGHELFRLGRSPEECGMAIDYWDFEHPVSKLLFDSIGIGKEDLLNTIIQSLPSLRIDSNTLLPSGFFPGDSTNRHRQPRAVDLLRKLFETIPSTTSDVTKRALLDASPELFRGFLEEIIRDLEDLFCDTLDRFEYLGPLRKLPRRHLDDAEDIAEERASGAFAWKEMMMRDDVRKEVNDCLFRLGTGYRLEVRHLIYEDSLLTKGPPVIRSFCQNLLRKIIVSDEGTDVLKRWLQPESSDLRAFWMANPDILDDFASPYFDYEKDEVLAAGEDVNEEELTRKARDIAYDALEDDPEKIAPYFRRHTADETAACLADSKADYRGDIKKFAELLIKGEFDRRAEIFVVDLDSGTHMTHRDIGVGISQILPVLFHAYVSKARMIAIEQPEIHIHPKLQAELGDVFIESALGENRNTFLLETHSEHLILRILRRIRETTAGELPKGMRPITPDDVSVLFVQHGTDGAEVIELPVTEDGDFSKPWPGGFFEERADELFGV